MSESGTHASTGGHEAHDVHHPGVGELLYPALNFAIFVFLLVRFLRGPIRELFRDRTARLREGLEAGMRARREAEELRAVLARDLQELPALQERLRADLRATAEREGDLLIASGREAAARIVHEAQQLAAQEYAAARERLRAETSEEALREATAMLRTSIRPEDQERFVRDFVVGAGAAS
jgi:F0F1-type ATP synthase membrane subunit b/b'